MPIPLFVFTLILLFGLLSYYLIFSCLSLPQELPKQKVAISGVSIIICAKNELENLRKNIPVWLKQQQIEFELVIVNHQSTDGSKAYLDDLKKQEKRLKVVHIERAQKSALKGKRFPLSVGVENAQYDYLVLSDADCYPNSPNHLFHVTKPLARGKDIVLGYSPYESRPGFVNHLVQYETTITALLYLSFARIGLPYMGVGRNLAYKKFLLSKEIFDESNTAHSGDDDLIIGKIANNINTAISTHPETFVYSHPPESFSQWIKQKQRHYSTARQYDYFKILLIGGFGGLNFLFYISLLMMLFTKINLLIVLGLYLSKLFLFIMFNYKNLKVLKMLDLIPRVIYQDTFWVIFLVYNHLKSLKANNGWS